jgi:dihydrolipoamide dehydrogenase
MLQEIGVGSADELLQDVPEEFRHADNGKVPGMHIMEPHASELIAEGTLTIQMGATARDIAFTMHARPTLSEAILETSMGQLDGSIHFQRR